MTPSKKLSKRERDEAPETHLVEGRSCGSCNVCCVALTIDEPELQKPQGYRCQNAQADNSCAIYEIRPDSCRTFYCGWRLLKWVREGLRPDVSGVLVQLKRERPKGSFGVIFHMLNSAGLGADGLAESIGAAVVARVPVYMHVPGPPGYSVAMARIDGALTAPVQARDKAGVLTVLRSAYSQGQHGERKPIILHRHAKGP